MQLSGRASGRYLKIRFDARELAVIRIACAALEASEESQLDRAAGEGITKYASQVVKANESEIADRMVSLFRPDEDILIEREDLELVRESLQYYSRIEPEKHAELLASILRKIDGL